MSTRYISNLAVTLAAGFLVVATQAFSLAVATSLIFAMAIGFTVIGIGMLATQTTTAQRAISLATAAIGGWTIVASVVFAPSVVLWLGFAAAVALVALGVVGLTAHELTTERVVHSLDFEHQHPIDHEAAIDRDPIAA